MLVPALKSWTELSCLNFLVAIEENRLILRRDNLESFQVLAEKVVKWRTWHEVLRQTSGEAASLEMFRQTPLSLTCESAHMCHWLWEKHSCPGTVGVFKGPPTVNTGKLGEFSCGSHTFNNLPAAILDPRRTESADPSLRFHYEWGRSPCLNVFVSLNKESLVVENVKRGVFFFFFWVPVSTQTRISAFSHVLKTKLLILVTSHGFSLSESQFISVETLLLGLYPEMDASIQWRDLPLLLYILEILWLVPLIIRILSYGFRKQ